ncbi:MAG TPA: flagellar hook-associated protein FlgL [Albitalea sp.]
MTRLSTAHAFDAPLQQLQRRQRELSESQLQLTSGKRVNRASDDPSAAARAERALADVSRVQADQRAVEASRGLMAQTESALGEAGDLLQRARELVVAAGNASYTDNERVNLANELKGIRAQLLSVANRGDGAGRYLFGGQGSALPPFVDAPGGVAFRGMAGTTEAAGHEQLPLAVDGSAMWLAARTGNGIFETRVAASTGDAWIDAGQVVDPAALTGSTYRIEFATAAGTTTYSVLRDGAPTAQTGMPYVANQSIEVDGMSVTVAGVPAAGDAFELRPSTPSLSVFDVLDRTVAELSTPLRSNAQVAQTNLMSLRDIDQSMLRLSSARADAGGTLHRIDSVTDRQGARVLAGQTERSNAEDLDMVHAISDFQAKQSGYDAALRSYAMVQRLSLFQYLNI